MRLLDFLYIFLLISPYTVNADSLQVNNIDQAIALALENNSKLKDQKLKLEGIKGLIDQSNSLPNPTLSIGTEDFAGDRSGFKETENTFLLNQKIELGGKRKARTSLAKSMTRSEECKTKLKLSYLIRDIEIAYSNVLLSQIQFELIKEQEEFAKRILKMVKEKVEYGSILALEETKAEIALQVLNIDRQKSSNALVQKKRILASFWNGSLEDIGKLDQQDSTTDSLKIQNPPIERYLGLQCQLQQIEIQKDNLSNEKAKAIPDIILSGGYRRFEEDNSNVFVAGISLPLPIFNRNEGKILQAQNKIVARKVNYYQYKTLVRNEVDFLMQTREILLKEKIAISKNLLPKSKKTLKEIQEAYRFGRVGYLDLIDSQRVYFDTKIRKVKNTFDLKINKSIITAITGQILNHIKTINNYE